MSPVVRRHRTRPHPPEGLLLLSCMNVFLKYKHNENNYPIFKNIRPFWLALIPWGEVVTSRCHGSTISGWPTSSLGRGCWMTTNRKHSLKKKWIRTVSNFISLIQFHLICQMLVKFSRVESEIKFRRIVRSLRTTAELKFAETAPKRPKMLRTHHNQNKETK